MEKNSNINNEKEFNLEENKNNKKRKLVILLVIIFVLSLVTTGLTTNLFGRLGTAFRNEGTFVLKHSEDNDKEVITNKALVFDSKKLTISLSDNDGKLSYSYNKIVPSEFTCETDKPEVATCYAADGYVKVRPKGVGETTVTVRTEANGKIYAATSKVVVVEPERKIELSSYKGIINLATNKNKEVSYYLVGMKGNVSVTSSDTSVATVTAKNGIVKITASKVGKANITVSYTHAGNGETYTAVYKLNVINESNKQEEQPVVKKKSKVSTLSSLTVSNGTLKFDPATTNYSIFVDNDVKTIDIDFEKTNENAKVIYSIDGMALLSLKNIPLKEGSREVVITVTSEDGSSTTSYRIAINKVDSELSGSIKGVTVNGKTLKASSPNTYSLKVARDVESVDISLHLSSDSVATSYVINNQTSGVGTELKNVNLKLGKNIVKFVVRNKFGITMVCFVTIEREAPSSNTEIDLVVLDEGYEVVDNGDNNYKVPNIPYDKDNLSLKATCVDSDCKGISYKITYDDGTTKPLDDLNKVSLKEGHNKIAITVVAEDGTTDTYYVNIYRPTRTIKFEEDKNTVIVEKEYTDIPYIMEETLEDGTTSIVELDESEGELKAILTTFTSDEDVKLEVHQDFVRVIPKNPRKIVGKEDTLTLKCGNREATTTLSFDIGEYELSSGVTSYDMTNSKANNTRGIILNTNLVESTDETLSIVRSADGKKLTICDKDKVHCVEVEVDSTQDAGKITLEYSKDSESEIGPNDLPIKITASGDGLSKIKVSGNVYGKSIEKDFVIDVNVTRKYMIVVYANDPDANGKFNIASKEWKVEISKEEKVDLANIPEPYKIYECKLYKFDYYTTDKVSKELVYNRTDKSIILGKDLTDDLNVYAIYNEEPSDEEIPETNSIWLKADDYSEGLPLFHNKEFYDRFNEDKVIYPGAKGSYEMIFKAEDDMNVEGIVLVEKNLDVDGYHLNMGYILHYNGIRTAADNKYTDGDIDLLGVKANDNSQYVILNQNYDTVHDPVSYLDDNNNKLTLTDMDNSTRKNVKFDTPIELKAGDQFSVTIFWQWVGDDDEADTAIGEYAAEGDNSINDKYGLKVGIIYNPTERCATDVTD